MVSKLEINGKGLRAKDLEIKLDGVPIKELVSLELSFENDSINVAEIKFYVDEIQMSGDVLASLQAMAKSNDKDNENGNGKDNGN